MTPEDLRSALTEPWTHGEHFDAAGVKLDARLVLDGLTLRSFDMSQAVLKAGISARATEFRGMSWLKNARVGADLDLAGATLRNDLRLDGLIVARLTLSGVRAEGVIDLDGAEIGTLLLDDCICLANVSLAGARIGALDVSGSDLMGGVWAKGAVIRSISSENLLVEGRSVDF